jgi:hypothetical protein
LVGNSQISEILLQPMTLELVTLKKTLEKILKDISTRVLKTKYTLNLGQLLQIIPKIKWYISNL